MEVEIALVLHVSKTKRADIGVHCSLVLTNGSIGGSPGICYLLLDVLL